jgi:hypothetical protein
VGLSSTLDFWVYENTEDVICSMTQVIDSRTLRLTLSIVEVTVSAMTEGTGKVTLRFRPHHSLLARMRRHPLRQTFDLSDGWAQSADRKHPYEPTPTRRQQGAMPREKDFKQTLCAYIDGFSLHAAVRCGTDDRQASEQLHGYIARSA